MTEKELAEQLNEWFKHAEFDKKNYLARNPVAKLLNEKLDALGYWRRKKPKLSFKHKEMLRKRLEKFGY